MIIIHLICCFLLLEFIETVSEVFAISSQFITKSSIMSHNVYHTLKRMHQDSKHNLFAYTMFYCLFYTYIDTLHFLPSNLHLQSHEIFFIDIFASFILFIILNEFKCSPSVYLDRIFQRIDHQECYNFHYVYLN